MIRINLIQPPGQHEGGKEREVGEATKMMALYALASAAVCVIVVGGLYALWSFQITSRTHAIAAAQAEAARLAGIQSENHRLQTELAGIEQHIVLIQQLQSDRTGPERLMTALGGLVDGVNGLYLLAVDAKARQLTIQGQADDVPAIARFIAVLGGSQFFTNVSLQQLSEADVGSRVSFKFGLECIYKPPVEMAASMAPVAPTGAAKRPPGR